HLLRRALARALELEVLLLDLFFHLRAPVRRQGKRLGRVLVAEGLQLVLLARDLPLLLVAELRERGLKLLPSRRLLGHPLKIEETHLDLRAEGQTPREEAGQGKGCFLRHGHVGSPSRSCSRSRTETRSSGRRAAVSAAARK